MESCLMLVNRMGIIYLGLNPQRGVIDKAELIGVEKDLRHFHLLASPNITRRCPSLSQGEKDTFALVS